ncbi:hypothetical protein A9R00_11655 [Oleispira antarctica]|uniref:Beta-lactamase-related domain-containing protein n=1 Tax=Oleispira antarctica TaxID=188908 RepID=A0A1Y5HG24_OLEAN|nr:hypothetical protein A9R00_11655 [Oleispira antarctica]
MCLYKKSLLCAFAVLLSGCNLSETITDYTASTLCSKLFLAELPKKHILKTDLIPTTVGLVGSVYKKIDYQSKTVTASFSGAKSKAIYLDNLGCTVVGDVSEGELRQRSVTDVESAYLDPDSPWPYGSAGIDRATGDDESDIDVSIISQAADKLFIEDQLFAKNTASVLVSYKDKLIFERYADQYQPSTPMPMFSISKTVSALLSGILTEQGLMDVHKPVNLDKWMSPVDPRHRITPHHLMSMTAGIGNKEKVDDIDPDLFDLLIADDRVEEFSSMASFAEPGSQYHYNTGNYLIQSKIIQNSIGGDMSDYYAYIQNELFRKIGINSAVVQTDNSGNMDLGMFAFMNARDMARFGLLLKNEGRWQDKQVVAKEWIDYMRKPSGLLTPWNTDYGVGIFPNTAIAGNRFWPSLPKDAMTAIGFRGQFIVIVPSLDLVIVRLGHGTSEDGILAQVGKFIEQVPKALVNHIDI